MDSKTTEVWKIVFSFLLSGKDRKAIRGSCKTLALVVEAGLRKEIHSLIEGLPFPLATVKRYHGPRLSKYSTEALWELSFFKGFKCYILALGQWKLHTADLCAHGNRKFICYKDHIFEPFHDIIYQGCYDPTNQNKVINSYLFCLQQAQDPAIKVYGRKDGLCAPLPLRIVCDEGRADYEGGWPVARISVREEVFKQDGDYSTTVVETSSPFGLLRFNNRLREGKKAEKAGCTALIQSIEPMLKFLHALDPKELGELDADEKTLFETPFPIRISAIGHSLWKIQMGSCTDCYLTSDSICIVTSILGRTGIDLTLLKHGIHYSCSFACDKDMHYYEILTDDWKETYEEEECIIHYRDKKIRLPGMKLLPLPLYQTGHRYLLMKWPPKEKLFQFAKAARMMIAKHLSGENYFSELEEVNYEARGIQKAKPSKQQRKKAKLIHEYFVKQ
jgi:hypothetical protein